MNRISFQQRLFSLKRPSSTFYSSLSRVLPSHSVPVCRLSSHRFLNSTRSLSFLRLPSSFRSHTLTTRYPYLSLPTWTFSFVIIYYALESLLTSIFLLIFAFLYSPGKKIAESGKDSEAYRFLAGVTAFERMDGVRERLLNTMREYDKELWYLARERGWWGAEKVQDGREILRERHRDAEVEKQRSKLSEKERAIEEYECWIKRLDELIKNEKFLNILLAFLAAKVLFPLRGLIALGFASKVGNRVGLRMAHWKMMRERRKNGVDKLLSGLK